MSLRMVGIYLEAFVSRMDTIHAYTTCDGALQEHCWVLLRGRSGGLGTPAGLPRICGASEPGSTLPHGRGEKRSQPWPSQVASLMCESWNQVLEWLEGIGSQASQFQHFVL